MKTEHTKGPWTIGSTDGNDIGIIARDSGNGGQMVAMAVVDEDYAQDTDEHLSNARLIAAAPELLAALQPFTILNPLAMPSYAGSIAIAIDAIAKATRG